MYSDSLWVRRPRFEPQWGQVIFYSWNPYRWPLGPTSPPLQWVPGLFTMGKGAGRWHCASTTF